MNNLSCKFNLDKSADREGLVRDFRAKLSMDSRYRLFLSYVGQHTPVSNSTIARWLKTFMAEAGIDISIFKAHSVRGASCSTAVGAGVMTKNTLDAADWSSEGTFQRFYCRELKKDDKTTFGTALVHLQKLIWN